MKIGIALIASFAFFIGTSFAAGYVNANDLEKGTFSSDVALEDNFALHGTSEKQIVVDALDNAKTAPDGEVFTQRINTKGAGNKSQRSVSFPVKAGEKVTIYGNSSSKTDTRTCLVVNEAGETVFSMDVVPYTSAEVSVNSFTAAADGVLYAWSKSSGIYIYSIKVE